MSSAHSVDTLDLLVEFPHAHGAFAELRRYVTAMAQFSDFPAAQTAVRLKAQLRRTADPVQEAELEDDIKVAERDGATTVPRIVWGSMLVAVYATFESAVRATLTHWGERIPNAPPFDTTGRAGFLKLADSYAVNAIGVGVFSRSELKDAVLELKAFRDSFAHSAGRIPARRTELHSSIDKARKRRLAVSVQNGSWIATPRLVAYYLLKTENAYKSFARAVTEEYVLRLQPSTSSEA